MWPSKDVLTYLSPGNKCNMFVCWRGLLANKSERPTARYLFFNNAAKNCFVFVLLLVCWREVPNKSASTESPHLLNDLHSRDKGQHIMVTKILKENSQKY